MRRQRRTELCVAKMAADIVNSDAVSERSAKRVSPRAVLLRCQDGQRGSGIDSAVVSRIRRRIELRLTRKYFCCSGAAIRRALESASHEILRSLRFKFKCEARGLKFKSKISKQGLRLFKI